MARAAPITIGRISLRRNESGLLAGGTQVGKSTLSDELAADYLHRYPKSRELLLDTKPRYQAEYLPNGMPAKRLYRKWDHGAYLPGSMLVESPEDLRRCYQLGYRRAIVQSKGWAPKHDVIADAFLEDSRRGRPQLLRVDETCDHFHGNGMPKGAGSVVVVSRAGAERGTGGLYCTQRTKGISGHLMEHMFRLWAFRLDNTADAKRFAEFGAPPFPLPTEVGSFMYWTKLDYYRVHGPYRLILNGRA